MKPILPDGGSLNDAKKRVTSPRPLDPATTVHAAGGEGFIHQDPRPSKLFNQILIDVVSFNTDRLAISPRPLDSARDGKGLIHPDPR